MTSAENQEEGSFVNVVFCEDIRDEAGNKKSLMGVIGGDVNVPSFPATIRVALYMEYLPGSADGDRLDVALRLFQDEEEVMQGKFVTTTPLKKSATFVVPMAYVVFEKASSLRVVATINGRPPQEILSKKVALPPST